MIELGVFSLWTGTKDFKLTRSSLMLYSAAIAHGVCVMPDTELVTDIWGLEIADRLGWNLRSFSTALQGFCPDYARHVWYLGKIKAQQVQSRPFVHIDLDLLLLGPLPPRLSGAAVMAQSKDHPNSYHDDFNLKIARHIGLCPNSIPYNTGLIGYNDMDFCREYCERSMRLSLLAAKKFDHGGCISILCEQQLVGEIARERRIQIQTAIPMPTHSDKHDLTGFPFVHLWGLSKENPEWLAKVEKRFADDFPAEYRAFTRGLERIIPIA